MLWEGGWEGHCDAHGIVIDDVEEQREEGEDSFEAKVADLLPAPPPVASLIGEESALSARNASPEDALFSQDAIVRRDCAILLPSSKDSAELIAFCFYALLRSSAEWFSSLELQEINLY